MRKDLMAFAAFLVLSAPALADMKVAAPAPSARVPGGDRQKMGDDLNAEKEQRFSARKAELSKQISDRISEMQARLAEMQQKLNCVDAAATPDTLRICFPNAAAIKNDEGGNWEERRKEWREHHEGWKRQHGLGTGGNTPSSPAGTTGGAGAAQ